jgi:hypothetical protein
LQPEKMGCLGKCPIKKKLFDDRPSDTLTGLSTCEFVDIVIFWWAFC